MSFESQLRDFLTDYEKLIILGVGNELKCDDGVGPYIIKKLQAEDIEDMDKLHRQTQKGKPVTHHNRRCMSDGRGAGRC